MKNEKQCRLHRASSIKSGQLKTKNILHFALLFCVLSFTFFIFAVKTANAASIYFTSSSQNFYTDDTFIVEARMESFEDEINVIDGSFSFNADVLRIKELSTGGSVFSLWAEQPSFSNEEGIVRFVGGVPDGFQGGNGLILKAIFLAATEGKSNIVFSNDTAVFLSDGKGTRAVLTKTPLFISIAAKPKAAPPKDEWRSSKEKDIVKPEFVEATISRDSRLFNNQYFVSFFATDADSGVAYYEIKEGDGDFKRVQSPYILPDQTLTTKITIKVVDNTGNETIISPEIGPEPKSSITMYLVFVIALLSILIVAFIVFRRKSYR